MILAYIRETAEVYLGGSVTNVVVVRIRRPRWMSYEIDPQIMEELS